MDDHAALHPLDSPEAQRLREAMVAEQLRPRGIRDSRVLTAFREVPRHLFCRPGERLRNAYADHPLPIGHGQTISQPLMVADMTECLSPREGDRVLEVGAGSGYQAAILSLLAGEVHTVERIPELGHEAERRLAILGLDNVHVHVGDGTLGWEGAAPYDGILVAAASPQIPVPLQEQLADGGTLVVPVGSRSFQELMVCRRNGSRVDVRKATGCRFVPLIGEHGWAR